MKSIHLFLLIFFTITWCQISAQGPSFPLRVSRSNKCLIDRTGKPFLIKEISAWGLIQALSEADESAFIDSIKKKGFNTLLVSIISNDIRFAGDPPNWQGIAPFKVKWDFSTYNINYFEHVDRFLRMAKEKNMLVLLVPCYPGYKDDRTQGWWPQLLEGNNNPLKSGTYGEFLGKRYKDFTNIIWVAGGDNNADSLLYPHMDNIISGIKKFDNRHLWTGHFNTSQGTNWSTGNRLYTKYIDIDGLYAFEEKTLGTDAPQYKTELAHYGKGRMIIQLDQSYEHDIPHSADNEDPQYIRRKNYDGLLSGCAGTSFSPGQKDNQCYVFKNWRPLMNTAGMQEIKYCYDLFTSRQWQLLIPDTTKQIIISPRGEYGSIDYVCAAKASDRSTYMAYLPRGGILSINFDALKIKKLHAWWFDPRSGKGFMIGKFPGGKSNYTFKSPNENDWVLVLDNAEFNLPMLINK